MLQKCYAYAYVLIYPLSNYLQPVQPALLRVGQARYYLSFLFLGIRHNLLFVPSHPLNSGMREDDENR